MLKVNKNYRYKQVVCSMVVNSLSLLIAASGTAWVSLGHTNLILCFSDSAGLICSKVKKKVKNVINLKCCY